MQQEMEAVVTEVFDRQLKLLTSIKGYRGHTCHSADYSHRRLYLLRQCQAVVPLYRYLSNNRAVRHEHKHRGHINRNGDETLRSMLYVAAWSASPAQQGVQGMLPTITRQWKIRQGCHDCRSKQTRQTGFLLL